MRSETGASLEGSSPVHNLRCEETPLTAGASLEGSSSPEPLARAGSAPASISARAMSHLVEAAGRGQLEGRGPGSPRDSTSRRRESHFNVQGPARVGEAV